MRICPSAQLYLSALLPRFDRGGFFVWYWHNQYACPGLSCPQALLSSNMPWHYDRERNLVIILMDFICLRKGIPFSQLLLGTWFHGPFLSLSLPLLFLFPPLLLQWVQLPTQYHFVLTMKHLSHPLRRDLRLWRRSWKVLLGVEPVEMLLLWRHLRYQILSMNTCLIALSWTTRRKGGGIVSFNR